MFLWYLKLFLSNVYSIHVNNKQFEIKILFVKMYAHENSESDYRIAVVIYGVRTEVSRNNLNDQIK